MGRHQSSYSKEERKEIVLTALRKAARILKFNFDENDYTAAKEKMPFICDAGHEFETLPTTVIKGHNCLRCSRPAAAAKTSLKNAKYTLKDAEEYATSKNGKCLSKEYSGKKLSWECEKRHTFEASFSEVKGGSWCLQCSRERPLIKLKEIVKTKRGFFDETKYKNTKVRLEFTCENGHTWRVPPVNILGGSWCRLCWNEQEAGKHTIVNRLTDAHRIAKERGGECLSKTWKTAKVKLKWRCANNHTWEAAFHDVRKGRWCPTCGKGVRERLCRHYLEQLTGHEFLSLKPEWLLNANGNRMELDGYCKKLSLAFEHQGKQHYKEIKHFNRREETLNWRLESDALKRKICEEKDITLIEIPYWVENENLPEWIENELKSKRPDLYLVPTPLPLSYLESNELSELQEIAESKGGKCLTPIYLGVDKLHKFRCAEGHEWEATPINIRHSRGVGSWCNECSKITVGEKNRKYTIEDMHKLAKSKKGKFLSEEFKSVNYKYDWECEKGHRWSTAPVYVMRGTWCRKCSSAAQKHSIDTANALAKNRGGKCISNETDYENSYSYLQWECRKGHQWWARYNNVRNSDAWCSECKGRRPKYREKPEIKS